MVLMSYEAAKGGDGATEKIVTLDSISLESVGSDTEVGFSLWSKERAITLMKGLPMDADVEAYMTDFELKLKTKINWKELIQHPLIIEKKYSKGTRGEAPGQRVHLTHNLPRQIRLMANPSRGYLQALGVNPQNIRNVDAYLAQIPNRTLSDKYDDFYMDGDIERLRDRFGMFNLEKRATNSTIRSIIPSEQFVAGSSKVGVIQLPLHLADMEMYKIDLAADDRETRFVEKLNEALVSVLEKFNMPKTCKFLLTRENNDFNRPAMLYLENTAQCDFRLQVHFPKRTSGFFSPLRDSTNIDLGVRNTYSLGAVKFPRESGKLTIDDNFPVTVLSDSQRQNTVIQNQLRPMLGLLRSKSGTNRLVLYESVSFRIRHCQGLQFLSLEFLTKTGKKIYFEENLLVTCIIKLQSLAAK